MGGVHDRRWDIAVSGEEENLQGAVALDRTPQDEEVGWAPFLNPAETVQTEAVGRLPGHHAENHRIAEGEPTASSKTRAKLASSQTCFVPLGLQSDPSATVILLWINASTSSVSS